MEATTYGAVHNVLVLRRDLYTDTHVVDKIMFATIGLGSKRKKYYCFHFTHPLAISELK